MRSKGVLTDADATKAMASWPESTNDLLGGSDKQTWIKARPKKNKHATAPCLRNAGTTALATRPDGMWIHILPNIDAADVFCVEVCGSLQNLQDKRSRFVPATSALVMDCRAAWLNETIYTNLPRWKKMGVFDSRAQNDLKIPIRYLRVLFALKNEDYKIFREHGVSAGHEYFVRHSSFGGITGPGFRNFLKAISPSSHFLTGKP